MLRTLLLTLALVVCHASRVSAQVAAAAPLATISVAASAEIRVVPDEVNLRLGIQTRDPKLEEAVKQSELRTAAVIKFLKESGIDAKDVQTDFVEIHPRYKSDGGIEDLVPAYYEVQRSLGVRLRKVTQFDGVLAGALKNGVTTVHGIEFRTTELRKHRDAARQQAIRAAKEKAVALAGELDAKVANAQTISEHTGGGFWGWSGASWSHMNSMSQNFSQAAPSGEPGEGNLAVGMISVTATVNVTFLLK